MIEFLMENLGTIIICLVLALIVGLIIRKLISDKKAGRHSCGGNCGSCGGCSHSTGDCHHH